MHTKLPEYLEFTRIADNGGEIQGKWPISGLKRLHDLLLNDNGEVDIRLKFGRQGKWACVTGNISGELALTCQRCMQPMMMAINTEFKLALVGSEEEADQVPEEFEPLLVDEDKLSIPHLLEEELLLAIPLVATHDTECSDVLNEQKQWQAEHESRQKKENPFSVLKDLIK